MKAIATGVLFVTFSLGSIFPANAADLSWKAISAKYGMKALEQVGDNIIDWLKTDIFSKGGDTDCALTSRTYHNLPNGQKGTVTDKVKYHTDNGWSAHKGYCAIMQRVPRYMKEPSNVSHTERQGWEMNGETKIRVTRCSRCSSEDENLSEWSSFGAYSHSVRTRSKTFYGETGWYIAEYTNPYVARKSVPRVHFFNKSNFNLDAKIEDNPYEEVEKGNTFQDDVLWLENNISSYIVGRNTVVWMYEEDNFEGGEEYIQGPAHMKTVINGRLGVESVKGLRKSVDYY